MENHVPRMPEAETGMLGWLLRDTRHVGGYVGLSDHTTHSF